MKKYIFSNQTDTLIKTINAEPQCGIDFCDECGDCLHCYGSVDCSVSEDGEHFWVKYIDTMTCPRCNGQKYDRGSCFLCNNTGQIPVKSFYGEPNDD